MASSDHNDNSLEQSSGPGSTPQSSAPLVQYEARRKPVSKPKAPVKPIERDDYVRLTLASAGLDPVVAGGLLRKAVDKFEEKLEAKRVQYFSQDGIVTDERIDDDTNAQLKAASELSKTMTDLFIKRTNEEQGGVAIQVNVSWFSE